MKCYSTTRCFSSSLFHPVVLSVFPCPYACKTEPASFCCHSARSLLVMIRKFPAVTSGDVSNAAPRNHHQMVMKSRLVVCLLWLQCITAMANFAFASRADKHSSKHQFVQLFTGPWATAKVCLAALFA